MNRFIQCFALMSLIASMTSCSGNTTTPSYSFTYASNLGGDYTEKMYYSDDYFSSPATEYNSSLATASMAMAMSSFASNEYASAKDYSARYHNNQNLMESLGFRDYQANQYYQEKPETDSLGATYCHKELNNGVNLIAIGLRGQGYDMEWASNFKVGSWEEYDGKHAGFYEASQIALNGLKDYLEDYSLSGPIKIWVSGYSRAGATANLLAGTLDEALRDKTTLLNDVTYGKEDIYAYCFEPPMGAYRDENNTPHSVDFNNIFNIVNREDPVPKVAMQELDFTRYGIDYFVSDSLSDIDYEADIKKVVSCYNGMADHEKHGSYRVDDFVFQGLGLEEKKVKLGVSHSRIHWTQGLFLDRLLNKLIVLGVKTRENYVENFQSGLTSLLAVVYSEGAPKASMIDVGVQCVWSILRNSEADILIDDLMHQQEYFVRDLLPIIQEGLDTLDMKVDSTVLKNGLTALIKAAGVALISDPSLLFTCLSVDNIKSIGSAHYPDLCFAHLMARDPNYVSQPVSSPLAGQYYLIEVPTDNENVNLDVVSEGKTIASFQNGSPVSVDSSVAYGIQDEEMLIYLPYNGKYSVSYDNGEPQISLYNPASLSQDVVKVSVRSEGGKNIFSL